MEEHYTDPGRRKRLFLEIRKNLREQIEQLRQPNKAAPRKINRAYLIDASSDSADAQRPESTETGSLDSWDAQLVTHGGWNISLRIILDRETHLLTYTRSLTDQSIMIDEEPVLSEFSLPVSNDAKSTYGFEISNGSSRLSATIDVKHKHMKIIGFQLTVAERILYSEGYF